MQAHMTRGQWALWIAGGAASLIVLGILGLMKEMPDWYPWVFAAATLFCLAATAVSFVLRKTRSGPASKEGWIEALTTARLGFLALIALAFFFLYLFLFLRDE
jgi:hypothetical protein